MQQKRMFIQLINCSFFIFTYTPPNGNVKLSFYLHVSVCDEFRYGQNCSEICGHCKDNQSCNHTNGVCKDACSPGFTGEICKDGIYFLLRYFLPVYEVRGICE